MAKQNVIEEIPSRHWADQVAEELIQKHPGKEVFTCASGISPSGMVHIGNFREAVTVEFVVRALRDRGKKVRFIYSWDDYDALRKVPVNLPNQEMIQASLRQPISTVKDPYGKEKSYATHFEKTFEREIGQLGLKPEYIYQNERYRRNDYADGIETALAHEKDVVAVLNKFRTEPLEAEWSCLSVFCKTCGTDITKIVKYDKPSTVTYFCKKCKKEDKIDFRTEPGVKLLWRVDWPMRWAKEGVDFEPGGKDHSSQGGSYETGAEIIRAVWKKEPPHYLQYDFVIAKGIGSKLSSSSGSLITLSEALEVYEPQLVRWIFASRKPNTDFAIAFDLDVMKAYDDFDRCERFAYGVEAGEPLKVSFETRIYELSLVNSARIEKGTALPRQFGFRHLCNILQINQGDVEKTKAFYKVSAEDEARFDQRAKCAWNWVTKYAPEEFQFMVRTADIPKTKFSPAVTELVTYLKTLAGTEAEDVVANAIYQIMKKNEIVPKEFFQDVYSVMIGKNNGPKLASFLLALGPEKAAEILSKSV